MAYQLGLDVLVDTCVLEDLVEGTIGGQGTEGKLILLDALSGFLRPSEEVVSGLESGRNSPEVSGNSFSKLGVGHLRNSLVVHVAGVGIGPAKAFKTLLPEVRDQEGSLLLITEGSVRVLVRLDTAEVCFEVAEPVPYIARSVGGYLLVGRERRYWNPDLVGGRLLGCRRHLRLSHPTTDSQTTLELEKEASPLVV